MIKASIVVPGRNVVSTIDDQMKALADQQTSVEWELVFVDDGSSDGSADAVVRWRSEIARLHVVRTPGLNAYGARNAGLDAARGSTILFCDADDRVPAGWVEAMCAALDRYEIVGGPTRSWWPGEGRVAQTVDNTATRRHLDFLPFASGGSVGVRRSLLERVGPWDARYPSGGDVELSWRAMLVGRTPLGTIGEDHAVLYRQRADLKSTFKQQFRQGQMQVVTYQRFREHGMERMTPMEIAQVWQTIGRKLPGAIRSHQLKPWALRAGAPLGRLAGSLARQTLYL